MFVNAIFLSFLAAATAVQAAPGAQLMSVKAAFRNLEDDGGLGSPCPTGDWTQCNDNLICQLGACADPATKPPRPQPPAPAPKKWQEQALAIHNARRANHGARPLQWNDFLTDKAQTLANTCAGGEAARPYGYNGAFGSPWFGGDQLTNASAVSGIESWYSYGKNYDFNHPGWNPNAGTFTQMVWRNTAYLGCAVYIATPGRPRCSNWDWYAVCLYSPAGNVNSPAEFAANVLRPGTPITATPDLPPVLPPSGP